MQPETRKTPEQIAHEAIQQLMSASPQSRAEPHLMTVQPHPTPGDYPGLHEAPQGQLPAFQPASYIFELVSYKIDNTRSRHEDTNHISLTVAIGNNPATSLPIKDMVNENNGTFPVNLSISTGQITDPNIGIVFHYDIENIGHASQETINKVMTDVGNALASQGAKAATSAIGAAVGLQAGSMFLPIIGSAIGAAAGWLIGAFEGILTADCDGPVAVESATFKGTDLWAMTAKGPFSHQTFHPGVDSAHGCGSNSKYTANWTVRRA